MPEYVVIGQATWSQSIEADTREDAINEFAKSIPQSLYEKTTVTISVADDFTLVDEEVNSNEPK